MSHIAYTSVLNADRTKPRLAAGHLATEHALAEAGVPFTLLRNRWYLENHTDTLAATLELGAVLGSAGEGRVAAATRADFAKSAAAVLTTDGHGGVYELGSDTPFTLAELAQAITDARGVTVAYHDLPPADFAKALITAGLLQPVAELLADSDLGIARGDLTTDRHDLSALIGAPTTTMPDAIRAALTIVPGGWGCDVERAAFAWRGGVTRRWDGSRSEGIPSGPPSLHGVGTSSCRDDGEVADDVRARCDVVV